eukprot:10404066-Alexandrium_andersonii.AAC.1
MWSMGPVVSRFKANVAPLPPMRPRRQMSNAPEGARARKRASCQNRGGQSREVTHAKHTVETLHAMRGRGRAGATVRGRGAGTRLAGCWQLT